MAPNFWTTLYNSLEDKENYSNSVDETKVFSKLLSFDVILVFNAYYDIYINRNNMIHVQNLPRLRDLVNDLYMKWIKDVSCFVVICH